MKKTTIVLNDLAARYFEEDFKSVAAGAQHAAENYYQLKGQTARELKGRFTRQELIAMIDSLNGLFHTPMTQSSVQMFLIGMTDSEELDGTFTRHEADWNAFKAKAEQLTSAQVFFLQQLIKEFWDVPNDARNLDGWVDTLAKKPD
jgi:hypothetical protein